jgi:hypothetical protein
MFSGGAGSWYTAKRLTETVDPASIRLLFADTLIEDQDLYRFLEEAAANVGGELVKVAEGRNPWQVFRDERFIGNTRADPCSKILKRNLLRKWLEEHHSPDSTTIYLGIDWTEIHRFERARGYWEPWTVTAPLCDPPLASRQEMLDAMRQAGIQPPRLYAMGFPHNNCGGFCIKAGQAHFANLLKQLPERYSYHEGKEEELRQYLEKDVAILRDRRGGKTRPMTLRAFRERLQRQGDLFDPDSWGGCGCFVD